MFARAAGGDEAAFGALVDRFKNLVWAVARNYGLFGAEAEDVFQITFVRLYEQLDRIHSPQRLAGWLATVARHECLAAKRKSARVTSLEGAELDPPAPHQDLDRALELDEQRSAIVAAFGSLSEQCQQLLRLLSADPGLSYDEIAEVMGYPSTGNIGPTRRRCLQQLQAHPSVRGLL